MFRTSPIQTRLLSPQDFSQSASIAPPRCVSLDALRGFIILMMVFVNDVAGVQGVPWWMKHMPTHDDGMTFVDLVFPAFLFIVGVSMPFALGRRLDAGHKTSAVWGHVLTRTIGLLVIGVLMVNMGQASTEDMPISKEMWTLAAYGSAIVAWGIYPRQGIGRVLGWGARLAGFAGIAYLAYIYRAREGDNILYLRPQWWGILGLIGWAYLTTALFYIPFRKQPALLVLGVFFLTALNIGRIQGQLDWAQPILNYVDLGGMIGGHGAITLAGAVVGTLFVGGATVRSDGQRVAWIMWFAVMLIVIGFLLRQPWKLSKDLATPGWCLICAGLTAALFAGFYHVVDMLGVRRPVAPLLPAGQQPLLAYMLPSIFYTLTDVLNMTWYGTFGKSGVAVGVARSVGFTFFILFVVWVLGKLKVRLRL